ncbi:hypothetical protein [Parapedobacter sp. DT-150]|uniref:hypothetical protein n=1 Tax=Parapedobacter sp. DT-150 TaxID=3396162 RepID=UPI003F193F1F
MKEKHTYHPVDAAHELPDALRVNPFTVPDGYFDGLHQRILRRQRDGEGAQTAWVVPSGYFDQLTDRITAQIAEQKLRDAVSEPGFTTPEGYFGQLEEQLLLGATLRRQAEETGFTVPAAYFDGLQSTLAERTADQATPIRSIRQPKWVAYAAAACIALAASAVLFFNSANDTANSSQLGSVPDQEILNYLELYGTANDMIYITEHLDDFDEGSIGEGLSEDDIEAYLNHTL